MGVEKHLSAKDAKNPTTCFFQVFTSRFFASFADEKLISRT